MGVPVAAVPQPTMLIILVFTRPKLLGSSSSFDVWTPSGLRNSWTNPTIFAVPGGAGGAAGAPAPTSYTGTVTNESLIITSFPRAPGIGLSSLATNSKGVAGGALTGITVSPSSAVAWVRQFTAFAVSRSRFG